VGSLAYFLRRGDERTAVGALFDSSAKQGRTAFAQARYIKIGPEGPGTDRIETSVSSAGHSPRSRRGWLSRAAAEGNASGRYCPPNIADRDAHIGPPRSRARRCGVRGRPPHAARCGLEPVLQEQTGRAGAPANCRDAPTPGNAQDGVSVCMRHQPVVYDRFSRVAGSVVPVGNVTRRRFFRLGSPPAKGRSARRDLGSSSIEAVKSSSREASIVRAGRRWRPEASA